MCIIVIMVLVVFSLTSLIIIYIIKCTLKPAEDDVVLHIARIKYTKDQADRLGLRGWCKNTSRGTVQGHIEGPRDGVESMMKWLKTTGSPSSRIDKAEFKNEKEINEYSYVNFGIVKD